MITKEALVRLVRSCRTALHLSEVFSSEISQGANTVFDTLAGELEDALYMIFDQHTEELEDSVVDQLIRGNLSDEEVSETLLSLVKK